MSELLPTEKEGPPLISGLNDSLGIEENRATVTIVGRDLRNPEHTWGKGAVEAEYMRE